MQNNWLVKCEVNKKHENKKKVWRNILPVACANVKRQNPKIAANRLEFISFPAHAQKRQVFLESEHLKTERERERERERQVLTFCAWCVLSLSIQHRHWRTYDWKWDDFIKYLIKYSFPTKLYLMKCISF